MGLACTGLPWVTAMETAMETAATVPTALATGVRQPTSHLSLQQEMVEVATGLSLPLSRQPRSAFRPKLLLQVHPSTAAWDQETVTEQALALEQVNPPAHSAATGMATALLTQISEWAMGAAIRVHLVHRRETCRDHSSKPSSSWAHQGPWPLCLRHVQARRVQRLLYLRRVLSLPYSHQHLHLRPPLRLLRRCTDRRRRHARSSMPRQDSSSSRQRRRSLRSRSLSNRQNRLPQMAPAMIPAAEGLDRNLVVAAELRLRTECHLVLRVEPRLLTEHLLEAELEPARPSRSVHHQLETPQPRHRSPPPQQRDAGRPFSASHFLRQPSLSSELPSSTHSPDTYIFLNPRSIALGSKAKGRGERSHRISVIMAVIQGI